MTCPVCDESRFDRLPVVRGPGVMRCTGCGCGAMEAQSVRASYADAKPGLRRASQYIETLRRRGFRGGSLLVVASGGAPGDNNEVFLRLAKQDGFRAVCLDLSTASGNLATRAYDAAIMLHQLQTQP